MVKFGDYFKKAEMVALKSTFVIGVITHLFALTNVLHNYDSVGLQPYGYGTGLESGRWLLSLLAWRAIDWFGQYNLPMINGLLMIFLLSVAAALFVSVYGLREKSAFCVGVIFATAPAVTSTMFFGYTAPFYGLGILFAVLAVWFAEKFRWGLVLSIGCTAASLGIYQAYVPLTIGMFVLLLLQHTLRNDKSIGKLILKGLYYCIAIALGTIVYYVVLQILLNHFGLVLHDYQGISSMGGMEVHGLLTSGLRAIVTCFRMPLTNYCELAQTQLVMLSYLLLYGLSFVAMVYVMITRGCKILHVVFAFVLVAFFAMGTGFIEVMVPNGFIYTIMVFSYVLVLCAPIVLWELIELPKKETLKKLRCAMGGTIMALVLFVCFNYGYQANTNYTALYYTNQKTENYLNSLVIQVRMTDGFTADKEWAMIGKIQDPMLYDLWESVPKYGGNPTFKFLVNDYAQYAWPENYMGVEIPYASDEKTEELAGMEQVKAMPCWPNAGSIAVVDNTMVVKFEELYE